MSVAVEVVDQTGLDQVRGPVIDVVRAVLDAEGAHGSMVVAFVEPQTIADLNDRYRGVSEPTDTLSFCYANEAEWPDGSNLWSSGEAGGSGREEEGGNGCLPDLGEVVVCPALVRHYAEDEGIEPGQQLGWALIHGTLHLLGYDHERDAGEMRRREQTLLKELDQLVKAIAF